MVRALAAAAHPGPTVAVTLLTVLLGVGVGLRGDALAVLVAAVLTGQLSVGWSNDAVDADRDGLSGRQDKPAATGRVSRTTLWVAAAAAGVATVAVSLLLGWGAGLTALLLPAAGWAYNLGVKSTAFSALAYAVGFGALPAAVYLATGRTPPWWSVAAGALLGVAAHIANVLPDLAEDAEAGVRGLPHRLGRLPSTVVMAAVLVVAAGVVALGRAGPTTVAISMGAALAVLGALLAATLAWRRQQDDAAFYTVVAVAVLDVVLLVLAT
jgi:4-hydroxybenzoate polyprenyltransferase